MLRVTDFDVLWPKIATACGAAAGSAGTAAVMLGDFALQLFGVPLQVVVASAAGAGLARAFMPPVVDGKPVGFWKSLGLSAMWTAIGCAGAPIAQAVAPAVVQGLFNREITLPPSSLGGLGAAIASVTWWGPKVGPAIKAWRAKNIGNNGGGGDAKP